jgi:thiamine kinase-like enzyme
MTNSSILIDVKSKKYIVRLPGKGSKELINRSQEYHVYNFLHNLKYDNLTVFISPDGMKITKYITNPRNCDPNKSTDVMACMTKLREFHELELRPNVEYFSLTANIDRYRELAKIRNHTPRQKYEEVYNRCLQIAAWIERQPRKCCLCQIDANPDNAVFAGSSGIPTLIDWEYAGLQDPHVDIAMWATYCNYSTEQFNTIMSNYFCKDIDNDTRHKIYGYAALAGMLWYNWCIYKQNCGVTYGDYTNNQFEYADKYSDIVLRYIKNKE